MQAESTIPLDGWAQAIRWHPFDDHPKGRVLDTFAFAARRIKDWGDAFGIEQAELLVRRVPDHTLIGISLRTARGE